MGIITIHMSTNGPISLCNMVLEDFNKAMESLKEVHKNSTNSARIWEELSKLDNIRQHLPADGEFNLNK